MKRVRVPAFRWGRDDVVVAAGFVSVRSKVYSPDLPVEQHTGLWLLALGRRAAECAEDKGIHPFSSRKLRNRVYVIWECDIRQVLTRDDLAPSWLKHFFSHIAACRQSSRCDGLQLTLGMETNLESAYVKVSCLPGEDEKDAKSWDRPDAWESRDGSTICLSFSVESPSGGEVSSQTWKW